MNRLLGLLCVTLLLGYGCKDTKHGTKGQPCKVDADCESELKCSAETCRGTQAGGQACKAELDCATGKCVGELCRGMIAAGQKCEKSFDCVDGLHCLELFCTDVAVRAEAIAEQGCACTEPSCLTKTREDLKRFVASYADDSLLLASSRTRMAAANAKLGECVRKSVFGR